MEGSAAGKLGSWVEACIVEEHKRRMEMIRPPAKKMPFMAGGDQIGTMQTGPKIISSIGAGSPVRSQEG